MCWRMEEVAEMVPMSSPRELSGLHSGWITSFCVVNFDLEYGQSEEQAVRESQESMN